MLSFLDGLFNTVHKTFAIHLLNFSVIKKVKVIWLFQDLVPIAIAAVPGRVA